MARKSDSAQTRVLADAFAKITYISYMYKL